MTTLILVKNGKLKVAYPKSEADFKVLRSVGLSVKFCKLDFLPLLRVAAANKGVQVTLKDFDELETKALTSLKKKWPGDLEVSRKSLVLSCPRDEKHHALMKSVRSSLHKFYQYHGMKLDYSIKRGSKQVAVTFVRTTNTSAFILNDER